MADDDVYGEAPSAAEVAALAAVLGLALDRYVKNRARRTTVENAKDDPEKPMCRWVVEPDACDFCKSRGDFAFSPEKAPNESHSGCKCHPDTTFASNRREFGKSDEEEQRYQDRIDNAVVVHDDFYSITVEEVTEQRTAYDAALKAKWNDYKKLAKQDGISPKVAYDSTVGAYFSGLSKSGRMRVETFVDLKDRKGHEAQLAKWFADAGHSVLLRCSVAGDTNDALIDGVAWEFKRITSKHKGKIIKRVTEHIPRQGPRFVVDLSESAITRLDAEQVVAELLDKDGIDEIMLVMEGKVKLFRK